MRGRPHGAQHGSMHDAIVLANDAFGFVLGLMGSRASTNLAENGL